MFAFGSQRRPPTTNSSSDARNTCAINQSPPQKARGNRACSTGAEGQAVGPDRACVAGHPFFAIWPNARNQRLCNGIHRGSITLIMTLNNELFRATGDIGSFLRYRLCAVERLSSCRPPRVGVFCDRFAAGGLPVVSSTLSEFAIVSPARMLGRHPERPGFEPRWRSCCPSPAALRSTSNARPSPIPAYRFYTGRPAANPSSKSARWRTASCAEARALREVLADCHGGNKTGWRDSSTQPREFLAR
jgi:hypothetical protein